MSSFCSSTSLHGWPHIPGAGKGEKIFWSMAILASLGAGGYFGIRSDMSHLCNRPAQKPNQSNDLSGGGRQGTLLGLLLFLVYFNDTLFSNQVNNAGDMLASRKNF